MSYLLNKKLNRCTVKINKKNRERCRALWMADPKRFGQITLMFPIDGLHTYKKYGLQKQYYIDAAKYYQDQIEDLQKEIKNIEEDLSLVSDSSFALLEEEKQKLSEEIKEIKNKLKKLQQNKD